MSVILFLLTLSVLVFVHEFGHFIAAKKSGVKVEEFGFGLPPRIFGKKIGETLYSLNLLPIGGFVKLKGEEGEIMGFGSEGSFGDAPNFKRFVIVVAGVVGNLILAYLIFVLLFLTGNPTLAGRVKVSEVAKDSPAAQANFEPGDYLVKVNGKNIENPQDFIDTVNGQKGRNVDFTVERAGKTVELKALPRVNPPSGEGPLGVRVGFDSKLTYPKAGLPQALVLAAKETYTDLSLMVFGLKNIISQLFMGRAPQDVTGVVGIYKLTSQALGVGFGVYLQFVALISLNLFMFNLLPIPALDGGRLLFVVVESVMRKKINSKIERLVNNVGLALLLTLFVLITIRDIQRF